MKATEFVKKYGIDEAKRVIKDAHWENISYGDGQYYSYSQGQGDVSLDDLRAVIHSHDICDAIQYTFGTYMKAFEHFSQYHVDAIRCVSPKTNLKIFNVTKLKLEYAIKQVEYCL